METAIGLLGTLVAAVLLCALIVALTSLLLELGLWIVRLLRKWM